MYRTGSACASAGRGARRHAAAIATVRSSASGLARPAAPVNRSTARPSRLAAPHASLSRQRRIRSPARTDPRPGGSTPCLVALSSGTTYGTYLAVWERGDGEDFRVVAYYTRFTPFPHIPPRAGFPLFLSGAGAGG